jgi:tryptophan synthase alpha chain
MAYGMNKFLRQAARAGVDGFIIPDLPVDDATDYLDAMQANRLSVVFLVAPTSPPERIKAADMNSSDFVYAVTVTGVTGTGRKFSRSTDRYLRQLRRLVSKPYVAGFGVSSPESAQRLCRYADGVVIGSALVKLIRDSGNKGQARRDIARFLSSVRKAI